MTNTAPIEWSALSSDFQQNVDTVDLDTFASSLGVSPETLTKLGIGRDIDSSSWTFPERNAEGEIIGISKRPDHGKKHMVAGSQRGLTLVWPLDAYDGTSQEDPVLVVEGASDAAAGLDLNFTTVGRPSATGGADYLATLLRDRYVVIVGEHDKGAGRLGADKTANALVGITASVKVIYPPDGVKDLREWENAPAGCNRDEVLAVIRRSDEFVPNPDAGHTTSAALKKPTPSQADLLVELAVDATLFHDPGMDSDGFATIGKDGHRENWRISSKGFRRWLSHRFYTEHNKAPGSQALQDALNVIAGQAIHGAPEFGVHVRLAEHDGAIYLDLADDDWRAVEVTTNGWSVLSSEKVPVKFVRRRGMKPLPVPETGGDIHELRKFMNVKDGEQWILLCSYLVASLRPGRPFPLLNINGEQGSAKSTLCRMVREVVDPNHAPLRRPPRDERDLMIAATNGWLVAFDNLSGLSASLSDCLCVLATGGGFGTRELFSDDQEKLFDAMRPVMINGIDDLATRPDLLDRSINLTLEQISEEQRRDEDELWLAFYQSRPRILGGLLDVVVSGLKNLSTVKLERMPRMADFTKFAVAAAIQLGWTGDDFLKAYLGNRASANNLAIESSPIGPAVVDLMRKHESWNGIAKELLGELCEHHADEKTQRRKDWPKSPQAMSNALRRIAPNLRKSNIDVTFSQPLGHNKRRTIQLEWIGEPYAVSAASAAISPGDTETAMPCGSPAAYSGDIAAHNNTQQPAGIGTENVDFNSESRIAEHVDHAVHENPYPV